MLLPSMLLPSTLLPNVNHHQGLASSQHRIEMCRMAAHDSPFIMVDAWEVV